MSEILEPIPLDAHDDDQMRQIRRHLEEVLQGKGFRRSAQMRAFLSHLVGQVLEGNPDALKESVLGIEVFGRHAGFDPRTDPIVRVEARRLRSRLAAYYRDEGTDTAIRIDIPKGGYVPIFTRPEKTGTFPAFQTRRLRATYAASKIAFGVFGLVLVLGGLSLWTAREQSRPSGSGEPSLLVVPFANQGPGLENEYFSDGLTEELIDALFQVEGIRVASRGTAFLYKGKSIELEELAENIRVDWLVEGSASMWQNRVRVAVRLVDVRSQTLAWSETFERNAEEVFRIQGDIARAIARTLDLKLNPAHLDAIDAGTTAFTEAHNLYLKGRYHLNSFSSSGFLKCLGYFQGAVDIDPDFVKAHAMLAMSYALAAYYRVLPAKKAYEEAERASTKAIALNPNLAEAHLARGICASLHDWDWQVAERHFLRALELDPQNSDAHSFYAVNFLVPHGRFGEAFAFLERALALDPTSHAAHASLGFALLLQHRYEEAAEQYRKAIAISGEFPNTFYDMGIALNALGRKEEARDAFVRALYLWNGEAKPLGPGELAMLGNRAQALALAHEEEQRASQTYVRPLSLAWTYGWLGEKEAAFQWLEKTYRERDSELIWLPVHLGWEPLHEDPRFLDLVDRVGLAL